MNPRPTAAIPGRRHGVEGENVKYSFQRIKKFFNVSIWKWHRWIPYVFSNENHTRFHVTRTIFNELSFK